MLIILFLFIGAVYGLIVLSAVAGWQKLPVWNVPPDWIFCTKVSVIVPARNEAENIPDLLQSLQNLNFPKGDLEIIVVDDFSSDNTVELLSQSGFEGLRVIKMSDHFPDQNGSSKKAALAFAIQKAKGKLIVTTDADVVVQPDWLRLLVSFYEKTGAKLIAAPVVFHQEKNVFEKFQSLDYAGMMGLTAAGFFFHQPFLCNGANLAFEKSAFEEVGGYSGIDQIASGDDMLLLEKINRRFRGKTAFLKNAEVAVFSRAKTSVSDFWQQRIRWASKTGAYKNLLTVFIQGWAFLTSWLLIISFLAACFRGAEWWFGFLILLLFKGAADFLLLKSTTTFFGKKELMQAFFPSFFLHTIYIAGIGLASFFQKKYDWKGRRLR